MKEIKFKIFNKKEKQFKLIDLYWFEENLIREIKDCSNVQPFYADDNCAVMQYTNFKDSNNEEIYFGDRVINKFNQTEIVCEITVAHWILDENKMNEPTKDIKIIGNKYVPIG